MAVTKTEHPYIVRAEGVCGGRPIIAGTRIPVWAIAGWLRQGYSPEQVQKEIYPSLSLAQIYDALSFYYDRQGEIDRDIAENSPKADELEHRKHLWPRRSSS